jgi:uncharacterized protein with HEPN domain
MKDENLYLIHISECIERIVSYVTTEQAFFHSTLTQDAVIRNLEIIGEAAKKLSESTRRQAPEIPWKNVCGMRDVLIHGYMGVDLKEVWRVVAEDLGVLKSAVERLRTDRDAGK